MKASHKFATSPDILVAKGENSVAISSPQIVAIPVLNEINVGKITDS